MAGPEVAVASQSWGPTARGGHGVGLPGTDPQFKPGGDLSAPKGTLEGWASEPRLPWRQVVCMDLPSTPLRPQGPDACRGSWFLSGSPVRLWHTVSTVNVWEGLDLV